ncbi:hypothetical protein PHYSODRAFT_312658 [Phytophthora sojae]|uniref:C2H2-type domain-containing protein n=1 Tax=Phytophthora sojae (strain P6497) TaxID=1094619 RepID=G4Z502_PHYSP|nr:hypothetical protein PHYSODRAFT_312658 [Phytophthora sojae]EGZ19448.1 hypothetical protein PHYSODRAFT_312658 [Phytophthora sojae]|eukprot:XP_009522165.1 hypothetical protein PHYSODRAFT_312658 [Phytophthora sojae]
MPHLEFGDKVVLPPKILLELQCSKITTPFQFTIRAAGVNSTEENSLQYCSVQEFSAPEGQVFLPYWLMHNLHVPEGGSVVVSSVTDLPRGIYCRLQPETTSFLDLAAEVGPKLLMETALRRYSVLSVNSTIVIEYGNVRYYVRVAELKPAAVVSLCGDVDLETDFMPPEFECSICHEKILQVNDEQHHHCPECTLLCGSRELVADHQRQEHTASCKCRLCGALFTPRPLLAQGRLRRKGDTSALHRHSSSSAQLRSANNNQLNHPDPLVHRSATSFLGLPTLLPSTSRSLQQARKLRKPKPKPRPNPHLSSLPQRVSKPVSALEGPRSSSSSGPAELSISSAGGTSHRAGPPQPRSQSNSRVRRRPAASGRLDKLL